jgi:hypothetical protein
MDDSMIVSILSDSYARQLSWYEELSLLVQKTLGQLALSRGSVGAVMGSFEKKQKIIAMIADERGRISAAAALWQERKRSAATSPAIIDLEGLLAKTESAIKEFLDGEDQLKRYVEHAARQGR